MRTVLCVMAYDVADDRRRGKLFRFLEQYGTPIQKSVFEGRLSIAERRRVLAEAEWLIDPATDRFTIYVISSAEEGSIRTVGCQRPKVEAPAWYIV